MHGKNLPKVVPKGTICLSVLTNSILLFCTVLTNKLITMNSTIFIGSATQVLFDENNKKVANKKFAKSSVLNINIDLTKHLEAMQSSTQTSKTTGNQIINLVVSKRKELGKYGETHSVKLRHVPKEAKETAKSNDDESNTDLDF